MSLEKLDFTRFNISGFITNIFKNCKSLEKIIFPHQGYITIQEPTSLNFESPFLGCCSLEEIDFKSFTTYKCNLQEILLPCHNLKKIEIEEENAQKTVKFI